MKRIAVLTFTICMLLSCASCSSYRVKSYYQDPSVFQEITAVVNGFYDDWDESNEICLSFDLDGVDFSSSMLYLSGENANVVRENHIWDVIQIGSEVTFRAARGQFWDGFHIQMVALMCDGITLLEFDRGYQNLMASLEPGAHSAAPAVESVDLSFVLFQEDPDGACRSTCVFRGAFYDGENQAYSMYFCHDSAFSYKDSREIFVLQGNAMENALERGLFQQIRTGSVCSITAVRNSASSWVLTSLVMDDNEYLS